MLNHLRRQWQNLRKYREAAHAMQREGWGELSTWQLIKLYKSWVRTMRSGLTPLSLGLPWLTIPAIDFLEAYLKPSMRVCEFGSGGSTVFFARRVKEVVSIEHESEWHGQVQLRLAQEGLRNVQSLLRPPEVATPARPELTSDPDAYRSSLAAYSRHTFHAYAAAIDALSDGYFDLLLVDGRARPSCLKHGPAKVRLGGLLMLDNSERLEYAQAVRILSGLFNVCHFPGPLVCGGVFIRSSAWEIASQRLDTHSPN